VICDVHLIRWFVWCWGGLVGRCRCGVGWCGVSTFLLDLSVETVVVIGGVFHGALAAVRFDQAVGALDVTVGVGVFVLALDVTGVGVVYAVVEVVWGWGRVSWLWGIGFWGGV